MAETIDQVLASVHDKLNIMQNQFPPHGGREGFFENDPVVQEKGKIMVPLELHEKFSAAYVATQGAVEYGQVQFAKHGHVPPEDVKIMHNSLDKAQAALTEIISNNSTTKGGVVSAKDISNHLKDIKSELNTQDSLHDPSIAAQSAKKLSMLVIREEHPKLPVANADKHSIQQTPSFPSGKTRHI